MLAIEDPGVELALPALDLRGLGRRLLLAGVVLGGAGALLLLLADHLRALQRTPSGELVAKPGWGVLAVVLEVASLSGYAVLLSLVAGRATPRIALRESAEITFAGTAATRVLPTAGAGGAALTLWTLARAGLGMRGATRTMLTFLVVLYSVFLGSLAVAGGAVAIGLVHSSGADVVSAVPAALAALTATVVLALARWHSGNPSSRGGRALQLLGQAVRDAISLTRSADPRLAGGLAYWLFDAAVLWSMLHALGSAPSALIIVLAYFVGQAATTLPVPGAVAGGMVGVLIALGVHAAVALPAVLAYRAVAIWLPVPVGVAAISRLRTTTGRWRAEDQSAPNRGTRWSRSEPVPSPKKLGIS
jgi:uncharacterized membrane protein YbhN (UPF0104 family)